MQCYFCGVKEELKLAMIVLWNVERIIFVCPSCSQYFSGKKLEVNLRALQESIARSFDEAEQEEIFDRKCAACDETFAGFLSGRKISCAYCFESFTPVVFALINKMESERRLLLCPPIVHEDISPERKAELSSALCNLERDPHYKVMHLNERLEALIRDEKFEEAERLFEIIKNLEAKSSNAEKTG